MIPEVTSAINEHASTHIPLDFLKLVSSALFDSYPRDGNSSSEAQVDTSISPAVNEFIDVVCKAYETAPSALAGQILSPETHAGVSKWLSDESRLATPILCDSLDKLYCSILSLLSRAVTTGDIPASSQTLDAFLEVLAPRLSIAGSSSVILAFQKFWKSGFEDIELDLSENVRDFLIQIVSAVPDLITVKGLEVEDSMNWEASQRLFPHSQALIEATIVTSPLVPASDPLPIEPEIADVSPPQPASTLEYEADISSSLNHTDITHAEITIPHSDPGPVQDSPIYPNNEVVRSDDVFGPPSMVENNKRPRNGKGRALGVTHSHPDTTGSKRAKLNDGAAHDRTIIPDSQDEGEQTEEDEDIQVMEQKSAPASSIFNRLLVKASSFVFSPSRRAKPDAGFEIVIPASGSPPHDKSKKRSRDEESGSTSRTSSSSSSKRSKSSRDSGRSKRTPSSSSSQSSSSHSGDGSDSAEAIVVSSDEEKRGRVFDMEDDDDDDDDEEEEELAPTPRTASRIRAEQQAYGGILHKSKLGAPLSRSNSSSSSKSKSKKNKELPIPVTQGRFDDAESLIILPSNKPLPNASPERTNQQTRVLQMMEEAAKYKSAVEKMDFEGVVKLLKHANELRDAAMGNLQERAMRDRARR